MPALEEAFAPALRLKLGQPWEPPHLALGPDFRPALAHLAWDPASACFGVFVDLTDADIYTDAVPGVENQPLWRLGDTAEFFIGRLGSPAYHEFHLAPGGQYLRLRYPSRKRFLEISQPPLRMDRHEPFILGPLPGERFQARIQSGGGNWSAFFQIPLAALAPRLKSACFPGSVWQINVARYDYQRGAPKPVHSATAPLTQRHFHRRHEWTRIVLA